MKMLLNKIQGRLISKFSNAFNSNYKKISFSQCGEDLIVKFIFDNLGIYKPTYIDIGAHHPYFISNTALFYQIGSRGINIEPDPILFKEFLKFRKEDKNLNIGIVNSDTEMDFYIISTPTLNTFSKEEAEKYSKEGNYVIKSVEKINVRTLSNILNEFSNGIFPQFLSLDAEGVDEIIIKQIDFDKNFPIVICIETISFSTTGNGIKNIELIKYIESKGYIVYADTNINTIFVKKCFWKKNK
jgi:FkbM family methyltransferase